MRADGSTQSTPQAHVAKWPVRIGAWRGVLLCVLLAGLLHLLFLGSVSRIVLMVPGEFADDQAHPIFSTRSIRIENTAPAAVVAAVPAPTKPKAQGTVSLQADEPVATAPKIPTARDAAESVAFVVAPPPEPARLAQTPAAPASAASAPVTAEAPASQQLPPIPPAPVDLLPAVAVAAESVAPLAAAPAAIAPQRSPLVSPTPVAAAPASPLASAPALSSPAEPAASSAPVATAPGGGLAAYNYLFPGSTRLKYDVAGIVKGFKYFVSGDLLWLQDGSNYTARLEISHFLLGSKVQTSKGAITLRGLEPVRFGEKVRSEVAAHFERDKGKVSFSANTPDVPIMPLAQDQVSIFVQLAAMFAADGQAFVPGSKLVFQAVGARGSEDWEFRVQAPERLKIQGKEWTAYKLLREHRAEYDTRAELWLAQELEGMPIRIRLSQTSGDEIDMVWTRSQKP